MRDRIVRIVFLLPLLMAAVSSVSLAEQREVTFPIDGVVTAHPFHMVFGQNGSKGFTLITESNSFAPHLFSFSTAGGEVLDRYDLSQDFGAGRGGRTFLAMHRETGLILVYGLEHDLDQKVIAFVVDEAGRLTKRWAAGLSASLDIPWVAFNSDGSRVYAIYNKDEFVSEDGIITTIEITTHLALLDTRDGAKLATIDLPSAGSPVFTIFNEVRQRPIMVVGGEVYVFEPDPNSLKIDYIVPPPQENASSTLAELSKDGRFVVTYGGYKGFQSVPTPELHSNLFFSYDLDSRRSTKTFIKEFYLPSSLAFSRSSGVMLIPLSSEVKIGGGGTVSIFPDSGSRLANRLTLADDGTLVRGEDLKLPRRSAGSGSLNLIRRFNTIAFSESGELAFISTDNGRLFTFDTSTSEIVDDQLLDASRLMSIQLLEGLKLIAYGNGSNKLLFADISTGPVVEGLSIKGNRATIKGVNFLAGARVEIDGGEVRGARRNPKKPGGEIEIPLSKADYPRGRQFTLVVINRDGKRSQPQTFQR